MRSLSIVGLIVGGVLLCSLAGCHASPTGGALSPSPDVSATTTLVDTPRVTGSEPAVVGGAPVQVAVGAPAICRTLAESAQLRGLATTLGQLGDPAAQGSASVALRSTANELRGFAASAGDLAPALTAVAVALESVASNGIAEQAAIDALVGRLTDLGTEAQKECGFPVG